VLRGNLVDLAVAVVLGAAFGAVVTSFVSNLVTPLIAAIGGKPDFGALTFTVGKGVFRYGAFLDALLSFLIIAAVIFFLVVKPVNALLARVKLSDEEPEAPGPGGRAADGDPGPAAGRRRRQARRRATTDAGLSGPGFVPTLRQSATISPTDRANCVTPAGRRLRRA
jgi:large conductance mechanosensitive channel